MKSTNDIIGSTKTKLNSGFIRLDLKKKKKKKHKHCRCEYPKGALMWPLIKTKTISLFSA